MRQALPASLVRALASAAAATQLTSCREFAAVQPLRSHQLLIPLLDVACGQWRRGLGTVLSPVVWQPSTFHLQHRMEASIRDASWAAADVAARRREQQGSGGGYLGSYLLGGLVPQRLAELWQGGGGGSLGGWGGGGGKADSSGSDEGGMYR